jgi:hypothetical protein
MDAVIPCGGPACVLPIRLHNPAPGTPASTGYTVTVNGIGSHVHPTGMSFDEATPDASTGSFTSFDFHEHPVRVRVATSTDVDTVTVRPLRHGIAPKILGPRSVEFDLEPSADPVHLSVEINGNAPDDPLYIFAGPVRDYPDASDPTVYKVFKAGVTYVAGQNGILPNSDLVIPAGKKIVVHGGAIVKAKVRIGATSATTRGSSGCQILGRGIIDASGIKTGDLLGKPLRCYKGRNVLIDGPIFLSKQMWAFRIFGSDDVHVNNVKVLNALPGTPDGVDIVGSRNVVFEHSFVRSFDDSVVLKCEKDVKDGDWSGSILNVTVKNCVIVNGMAGNALGIGWETGGWWSGSTTNVVDGVLWEDIDIIHKTAKVKTNRRAAISIHNADGNSALGNPGHGRVRNVTYRNVVIEDCAENYVFLWNGGKANITENVLFDNVVVIDDSKRLAIRIDGTSETHSIRNVEFRHCFLGDKPLTAPVAGATKFASNVTYTA